MRHRPHLRKAAEAKRPRHGRPETDVLVVPTFRTDSKPAATQVSSPATPGEEAVEDAVRRIVEAAYT